MERRKIKDLCKTISSNLQINKLEDNFGDYPLYGASGFVKGLDFYKIDKPYVSIVKDGAGVGRIAYHEAKSSIVGTMQGFINNDDVDLKFLYYALKSQHLDVSKNGSTIPHIYFKNYGENKINFYSLPKQKEIADFLDNISESVENKRQQLSLFDELIKSRFVEMFSNYKAEKTINEIASICRGASPRPISNFITKDNGENWIKIGDVGEDDVYITHTAEKVTKAGADKSRRVKPGDFILSNSMSFGRPYILGINGCVHDGWLIISNYEKTFEPLFFYYLLRSNEVQMQFDGSANGATVRNLNSDLVKKVVVMTPPMDKQKEFVVFAEQVDKSKFIVQQQIKDLQELLNKKMDEYFGD